MKRTWFIYLDGVFQESAWEETKEEALASYYSFNSPPEEGDAFYPGDVPMTVTIEELRL